MVVFAKWTLQNLEEKHDLNQKTQPIVFMVITENFLSTVPEKRTMGGDCQ